MDTFKSYFKLKEWQDLVLQRKTWIIAVLVVVLVALLSVIFSVVVPNNDSPTSHPELTSLKNVCSVTLYPDSCFSSISKFPSSNTTDPKILFKLSLKVVFDELLLIADSPKKLANTTSDPRIKSSLGFCAELIDLAMDSLEETVSALEIGDVKILNSKKIDDLHTSLSAVSTYHETCFDEVSTDPTISRTLKSAMQNSTEYTSNSLAIVARVLSTLRDFETPVHRRLLNSPNWVSPTVRRLLQDKNLTPNVTVAKDGSGDVKTVNEAVAKVPIKGKTMFLIYVKSGTYVENVELDKSKRHVMMYGDGKTKTIISGSHSNGTGFGTSASATFGVKGIGFIMREIGIINTAGPTMGQAVAFRSESEASVYYRCSFDGYQDALYPHANTQFYRDCDVTGTVDFICGDAAAVFQNCTIRPRQPLPGQYNTITAQSRSKRDHKTGFSIQRCTISANGNVTAATYLGRPWKKFSTTVIMESTIGPLVKAEGWMAWDDKPNIFYGEYKNSGPGSDLTQRITWDSYKPVMSDAEAKKFTVATFLKGNDWLPATGVPYEST